MSEQLTYCTGQTSIAMSMSIRLTRSPERRNNSPHRSIWIPCQTTLVYTQINLHLVSRPCPVRSDGYPAPIDSHSPEIHPAVPRSCLPIWSYAVCDLSLQTLSSAVFLSFKHACNAPTNRHSAQTNLRLYSAHKYLDVQHTYTITQ